MAAIAYAATRPDAQEESTAYPRNAPPIPKAATASPLQLRDVAPADALAINRQIPFSKDPNPAARPFRAKRDSEAYGRALECLTTAVYYEAGNETAAGQRAVAQVILNRVRHPAFAIGVCGVIYEGSTLRTGCQFSFTCDGSLRRRPNPDSWRRSRAVAKAALDGAVFKPVGYATHYHANYVVPYWATGLAKAAVQDTHIFYRWPGWWGTRPAFRRGYPGAEPDPAALRLTALRVPHAPPRAAQQPEAHSEISFTTDPRIELVAIVQLLAARAPEAAEESAYQKEVRRHFAPHAEHLAVQLYRQLTAGEDALTLAELAEIIMQYSPPPTLRSQASLRPALVKAVGGKEKLDGFIAALRDFSRHSSLNSFFGDHRKLYAKLSDEASAQVQEERDKVRSEQVGDRTIVLAPLLQDLLLTGCNWDRDDPSRAWAVLGIATDEPKYERVLNGPDKCRA